MAYQYQGRGEQAPQVVLSIEQERRRNAEIARTIHALRMERQRLEHEAEQVTSVLSTLRANVSSARFETTKMAAYREAMRRLPAPRYGGKDGLLAAVAEIEEHEARKDKPRKPRPEAAHGSKRRYYEWNCRCETCNEMIEVHRTRARERERARKRQDQAA